MFRNTFLSTFFILLGYTVLKSQDSSQIAPANYINPGKNINSEYVELNPQVNENDTRLYFVREDHSKNNDFQEIWCSEKDTATDKWLPAYKLPTPLNKSLANSVARVFPNRDELLIKGYYKKGKYKGRGYSLTTLKDGKWSIPLGLEVKDYGKLDKGIFNNACMSPDEKVLIFSFCEVAGGKENNLYASFKNADGTFSTPQKIDAPINIEGSFDFAPFISDDGKALYFSSDRPGGFGGNDIYKSQRLDESWLRWSEPVNMGNRVNTAGRDSYFSTDSAESLAYMVSDVNALGKTDIVIIRLKTEIHLYLQLRDSTTRDTLNGTILFSKPDTSLSTSVGEVYLKQKSIGTFSLNASVSGYKEVRDSIVLTDRNVNKKVVKTLLLASLGKKTKLKIIFNPEQGLKAKVKVHGLKPQDEFEPDREGKLALNLAQKNKYHIEITKDGYAKKDTIIEIPEGSDSSSIEISIQLKPKTYKFPNLYFDTNKSAVNSSPDSVIADLVEMMTLQPHLILYIYGHTDDVGSEPYNLELSKRRAKSIQISLVQKGINPNRIKSTGYGETRPQVKGITPEARVLNRRIEFMFETLPRYR